MQSVSEWAASNPKTTGLYIGFLVTVLLTYSTLKTNEHSKFDFLLTLSAGFQTLAFGRLVCDTRGQVTDGLSVKTLWAFLISHVSRLSTTFWGTGYVPEDSSRDCHIYQMLELTSVFLLAWKIHNVRTARGGQDLGQGFDNNHVLMGMVTISFSLAYVTKSTGHNDYVADVIWMFSVWLEAFALVPQVRLLMVSNHVDESALHFAGLTCVASLVFAGFWWKSVMAKAGELIKDGYQSFLFGIVSASAIRMALCCVYLGLFSRTATTFAGDSKKGGYELCGQEEEL